MSIITFDLVKTEFEQYVATHQQEILVYVNDPTAGIFQTTYHRLRANESPMVHSKWLADACSFTSYFDPRTTSYMPPEHQRKWIQVVCAAVIFEAARVLGKPIIEKNAVQFEALDINQVTGMGTLRFLYKKPIGTSSSAPVLKEQELVSY
jgi:hypothetical protein